MRFHILIFITLMGFAGSSLLDSGLLDGEDSLLHGGWSSCGLVLLLCLCLMDHSIDTWMHATSCVIFFLDHLSDYV